MRKEVFFAIITGAALGLIVAVGVWRANGALKNITLGIQTNTSPTQRPLQTPSSSPRDATGQLTLLSPNHEEVIIGSTVNITGTTKANAWIVTVAGDKVYLTKSDAQGSFSEAPTVAPGITNITVTAFEKTGQTYVADVTVVSTSALAANTSPTPVPQSSDSVRAKVQEKLDQATNKAVAFIGTITDKTDTGIQIKSAQGEIKQTSVAATSEFERLGKTNKTLTFADIAIGDYVAAIGYRAASGVLDTKRIYVTTSPSANAKAAIGTVSRLTKKDLDIRSLSSNEITTVASSSELDIYLVGDDGKFATKKFSDILMGDTLVKADSTLFIVATSAPKASASPKASAKPVATPKPTP
jgi:hypothetical protein